MKKLFICFILLFCSYSLLPAQQRQIDSLENLLKIDKEDTNKVNQLNSLSDKLEITGSYDSSIAYAIKAMLLAQKLNSKTGVTDAYRNIGYAYYDLGDYLKVLKNDSNALRIDKEIDNKKGIASDFGSMGRVYSLQGNYGEALECDKRALAIFKDMGYQKGIASNMCNIGTIYTIEGNYPSGLEYYLGALSISLEIADRIDIANNLGNIGLVYYKQGSYNKALEYHSKAILVFKEIGNKNGVAANLSNIGNVYYAQRNYSMALEYYMKSYAIENEIGDKHGIVTDISNISSAYEGEGDFGKAMEYNEKALSMDREIGEKEDFARNIGNKGSIYTKMKQYKQAKIYLDSGLFLSKEVGALEGVKITYDELALLDSSAGNYKEALADYKEAGIYKDSLLNEANTKKMVQAEMTYEFDQRQAAQRAEQDKKDAIRNAEEAKHEAQGKTQRVIIWLIASVTLVLVLIVVLVFQRMKGAEKQKLIAEQQKSWLELKALRTQMNPHFLYNTINSIQSFVLNNDTKASSNYLAQFAGLMRGVLENSRKDKITIAEEIEGLSSYLDFEAMRFPSRFHYSITVDEALDKDKTFLPPLLVQPYVENAIWHGLMHLKSGEGQLSINFGKEGSHIKCTVDDNGIGRKAAAEIKRKSVHKSIGLSIVAERMESMNKMYHWDMSSETIDKTDENGNSKGTRVVLILPLILNSAVYA